MNEKKVKLLHEQFTRSVSELRIKDNSGTSITVNYIFQPAEGRQAQRLWDFAMSVGYESMLDQEPKFNYDRLYCFVIEQAGEVSRVMPVRTQSLMSIEERKRWKVRNGKKRSK